MCVYASGHVYALVSGCGCWRGVGLPAAREAAACGAEHGRSGGCVYLQQLPAAGGRVHLLAALNGAIASVDTPVAAALAAISAAIAMDISAALGTDIAAATAAIDRAIAGAGRPLAFPGR